MEPDAEGAFEPGIEPAGPRPFAHRPPSAATRPAGYFSGSDAAHHYARGRPAVHAAAIERVARYLRLSWPVERAVDVACGTGLSTLALLDLAREIVGVDISVEMIRRAGHHPRVTYLEAPAERLPLPDSMVDLITVCAALHWLDVPAFLREAHRVLRPTGRLVIYEVAFTGHMTNNPGFHTWMKHVFLPAFPFPPRRRPERPRDIAAAGFHVLGEQEYRQEVALSADRLVDYLLSRSNVIAAVEDGRTSFGEMRTWLAARVAPFFEGAEAGFSFGGPIWYFAPA